MFSLTLTAFIFFSLMSPLLARALSTTTTTGRTDEKQHTGNNVEVLRHDYAPNILVFMVEDFGFNDAPFMESVIIEDNDEEVDSSLRKKGFLQTTTLPTLSGLASNGIILDHFYTSPTSLPSRSMFLTGELFVGDSIKSNLPSKLQCLGYRTVGAGKWHLSLDNEPEMSPSRHGFEFYDVVDQNVLSTVHHMKQSHDSTTADMAVETLKLLQLENVKEEGKKEPFFVLISFQGPEQTLLDETHDKTRYYGGCDEQTANGDATCRWLKLLDLNALTMVDYLKSSGQWEDTVFVFVSTNGGDETQGARSSNHPLRGGRGSYYEGGIRVPAFIGGGYIDQILTANGRSPFRFQSLVHMSDLHHTILGMTTATTKAGSDLPKQPRVRVSEGINQWPMMMREEDKSHPVRAIFIHHIQKQINNNGEMQYSGAVRFSDFKLIVLKSSLRKIKMSEDNDQYRIFNIKVNPLEIDAGDKCMGEVELVETCKSLHTDARFDDVKRRLVAFFKKYATFCLVVGESRLDSLSLTVAAEESHVRSSSVNFRKLTVSNYDILSKLYDSTNGAGWTTKTNWMTGTPCLNSWYGVSCDSSNIVSLYLFSNSLSGSIPSEIGLLSSMSWDLYLYSNNLCGDIPPEVSLLSSSFSSGWSIITGNSLGTPCPDPTPTPTSDPTPTPTSPNPTPTPTLTFLPTLTLAPTPVPTVICVSGEYFDGTTCSECSAGYYSSFTSAPYPSKCLFCPAGQYNIAIGSDSCVTCDEGKLSSTDGTYCADCDAGEYAYNKTACLTCEAGRYAPQALSDECLVCSAGSHTGEPSKATTCTSCNAGTYSIISAVNCTSCELGKQSSSGSSECALCLVGFYANAEGSSSCTACSAGTITENSGSSNCTSCVEGKYQGSTGQSNCNDCEAGKYAPEAASSSCVNCAATHWSSAGSTICDLAFTGYYISSNGVSFDCPKYATCYGGKMTPIPDRGYWVDHKNLEYAGNIFKCPRKTCKGGGYNSSSCWLMNHFNTSECNEADLQCTKGASGPICGSCLSGFLFRSAINACEACGSINSYSYVVIGIAMIAILVYFGFYYLVQYCDMKDLAMFQILSYLDNGCLKVIWVTYQIIVSSSFTLDITYPYPFTNMLGVMSVFSFDFLSLKCLIKAENSYFTTLYLWCILPIIMSILILVLGWFRSRWTETNRAKIMNDHIWCFLLWTYIVLPSVSSQQLQTFDCVPMNGGDSYIRSDTSVSCESSDYKANRSIIICFVLLYHSIPLMWFLLLYRMKEALDPPIASGDLHLAIYIRKHNQHLAPFHFLFDDYKCSKWWFEIADMYRRVAFIGLIPLLSPKSTVRASLGLLLAFASVGTIRELQPYQGEFVNSVANMAQYSITVTYYFALSLSTDLIATFGLEGEKLGTFLIVFNLIVIIFVIGLANRKRKAYLKKLADKELRATQYEDARGFSSDKFQTTLESIRLNDIPSSDAIVFHFTSFELAKSARKSGIVAQKAFNGVPLTLRQPYRNTGADFKVFKSKTNEGKFPNESVLVLSLPKRYLDKLPGHEEDRGLCMISADVLHALRPTSFSAVVDEEPWIGGFAILPPQSILRSYHIMTADGVPRNGSVQRESIAPSLLKDAQDEVEDLITEVVPITSIQEYLSTMDAVREHCDRNKLIPLFHYTDPKFASLILQSGLRMSSQGQGDGGVYVSTQGPASYGIGSPGYEDNIIKDCFGVERLQEYLGKGKLDVILVYGCCAQILDQTPGGRLNAKMVTKSSFGHFSLEDVNRNYFLRPDRILAAFRVFPNEPIVFAYDSNDRLAAEVVVEKNVLESISSAHSRSDANVRWVEDSLDILRSADKTDSNTNLPLHGISSSSTLQSEKEGSDIIQDEEMGNLEIQVLSKQIHSDQPPTTRFGSLDSPPTALMNSTGTTSPSDQVSLQSLDETTNGDIDVAQTPVYLTKNLKGVHHESLLREESPCRSASIDSSGGFTSSNTHIMETILGTPLDGT